MNPGSCERSRADRMSQASSINCARSNAWFLGWVAAARLLSCREATCRPICRANPRVAWPAGR